MQDAKRKAARAAMVEIPEHGVVGLGTGSTARLFVEELAARVRSGSRIVGVPTSDATRLYAESMGIPLLSDEGPWEIDVNVDGADEVSAALDLIKGGGGAHAREKIVNYAAARNIVIVDTSKMSTLLGERSPVPVEVLPFAHCTTKGSLCRFGEPRLRLHLGSPMRTDAGNFIYDLITGPIDDVPALDVALHAVPGVVDTGLFVRRAALFLVADDQSGRHLQS